MHPQSESSASPIGIWSIPNRGVPIPNRIHPSGIHDDELGRLRSPGYSGLGAAVAFGASSRDGHASAPSTIDQGVNSLGQAGMNP
jgi:hypothetical protein